MTRPGRRPGMRRGLIAVLFLAGCNAVIPTTSPGLTSAPTSTATSMPSPAASSVLGLSAGLPIVATRHCDIPSLVLDGVNGLLTDEGDVKRLADALHRLASGPDLCARFASDGRAHVERSFDVRVLGRRLGATYAELAAEGG